MPNRTLPPLLHDIKTIDFVKPHVFDITDQTKLYFMKEVPNDTARIELYFNAGTIHGDVGIASFVNGLLLSGTAKKTSNEIHNAIDALGGFHESGVSTENAMITVYALRQNIVQIVNIICDAIENITFSEHEVEDLINERRQKFKVSMEKVGFLAQRILQERLFYNTDYGRIVDESTFENVAITDLKKFHRDHYLNGLQKVVVVGNLAQDEIDELIDKTGRFATREQSTFSKDFKHLKGTIHSVKEGAIQSAIRIGRILFNKKHDDYLDFLVLNTILGDYFGSRLMTNIREDKGYTYGIGTMLAELHESGYFLIATEVRGEVKDDALKEIRFEIERLQNELVSETEMLLVKNYMLGQLLKSADGPYAMMDLYQGVEPYEMELDFYNRAIQSLNEITAERIQELAKKYLIWDDMTVVSVG